MTTSSSKLDTVRKLLAKAEGAATPEEAEAYTAKATELMARHGIDEALLDATREVREEPGFRRIEMEGSYRREKANLACWLINALGGSGVVHSWGRQVTGVTVYGMPSDLERHEILYTSLLLQATSQVVQQRPPWWSDESTAAYRRSWFVGFANEVAQRVRNAEARAAKQATEKQAAQQGDATTGTSVELVLIDRKARVERRVADDYPKLKKAKSRTLSGSGYREGAVAGQRADIGSTRVGGARTAIR